MFGGLGEIGGNTVDHRIIVVGARLLLYMHLKTPIPYATDPKHPLNPKPFKPLSPNPKPSKP